MNRYDDAYAALGAVIDPELDEPITDLGFVRSLVVTDGDVEVHLRLPTSFCAPNFAYLMASDAKDALTKLDWTEQVVVELDDHHDSDIINAGLATDAGYRGTFGQEADSDLDDLRLTFQRKAHTAAMERCLTQLLRSDPDRPEASLGQVRLNDLPDNPMTSALLRRRAVLGLSLAPHSVVMVDHHGRGYGPDVVSMGLRRARSTRISIDGNAHFCRGLLRTRYPAESSAAQRDPTFVPLATLTIPD
jgi:metal-sulfur cluster biosynthetic enzyme